MFHKIENQIILQALRLPNLKPKHAKKMELVLDQAYRALKNKQPKLAHQILQAGGALVEENKSENVTGSVSSPTSPAEQAEQTEQAGQAEQAEQTEQVGQVANEHSIPDSEILEMVKTFDIKPPFPIKLPEAKLPDDTYGPNGPKRTIEYIKKNFKGCLNEGLVKIPGNNHCMFQAFAYSLLRTLGQTHQVALTFANGNKIKFRQLAAYFVCKPDFGREKADNRLLKRKIDLLKIDIEKKVAPCPEDPNIKDINSYCKLFAGSQCWGDHIELAALLQYFKKNAIILRFNPDAPNEPPTAKLETYSLAEDEDLTDQTEVNPRDFIYLLYTGRHYESFNPDALYEN